MAAESLIVAEAVLEDKLADFWPDYPCLYDVWCPEFKNRDLRDKAFQELPEKLLFFVKEFDFLNCYCSQASISFGKEFKISID